MTAAATDVVAPGGGPSSPARPAASGLSLLARARAVVDGTAPLPRLG